MVNTSYFVRVDNLSNRKVERELVREKKRRKKSVLVTPKINPA